MNFFKILIFSYNIKFTFYAWRQVNKNYRNCLVNNNHGTVTNGFEVTFGTN